MKPPILKKVGNKKTKTKASSHKANIGKLSNKRNSRLAKQGKLKQAEKKKKKKQALAQSLNESRNQQRLALEKEDDQDEMSYDEDIDDEDTHFLNHLENANQFAGANLGFETGSHSRGKKRNADELEEEDEYEYNEERPRSFTNSEDSKMKMMLPIIAKGKVIHRLMEKTEEEDESKEDVTATDAQTSHVQDTKEDPAKKMALIASLNSAQLFAYRRSKIIENKEKIASLSNAVLEDPESNMKKLKELRLMLGESDLGISLSTRKYAMVSLMEVFKDIVPGYRLRIPTEKEKTSKVKKETKSLWDYEASFLLNYRIYLDFLETMARKKPIQERSFLTKHGITNLDMPHQNAVEFGLLALKCLCEMLTNHPHFNYRNNLIVSIVPFTNHKNEQYSSAACDALKTVFRCDKLGNVTLEIVRAVSKMVKKLKYRVKPKAIETFLCLKIKNVDLSTISTKVDKMKKKEKMMKLSKRERKRLKEREKLQKEMLEVKASEDKSQILRIHTDIIQSVFETYIRVIKLAPDSALLSPVLEGLAQFAHLINIEYFDSLFDAFNNLIDNGDLTTREKLHCMQSAFTILSNQGNILNIDPMNFYKHFYSSLLDVQAGSSEQTAPIVIDCLDTMIQKRRRQMSQQRILAFMKRLSIFSLQQTSDTAMAYLATIRKFILTYKYSDILFDTDAKGNGVYLPLLDDPEHCCASSSCMWELHLLQKFYDPDVRKMTEHLIHLAPLAGEHQLSMDLARKSPKDLYDMLQQRDITQGSVPETCKKIKKMRVKRLVDGDFENYLDETLQSAPSIEDTDFLFTPSVTKS